MTRLILEITFILIIEILKYFQQKKKDMPNSMTHTVKISAKYFTFLFIKTQHKVSITLTIG